MSFDVVDKVIITQESFGKFVNNICPDAYQSMTHVDFQALDHLSIRPIGVYGSKSELVRYFRSLDMVDDDLYDHSYSRRTFSEPPVGPACFSTVKMTQRIFPRRRCDPASTLCETNRKISSMPYTGLRILPGTTMRSHQLHVIGLRSCGEWL